MIYVACRRTTKSKITEPCIVPICAMRRHERWGYQGLLMDPVTFAPYDDATWGDVDVWLSVSHAINARDMMGLKLPRLEVGEQVAV